MGGVGGAVWIRRFGARALRVASGLWLRFGVRALRVASGLWWLQFGVRALRVAFRPRGCASAVALRGLPSALVAGVFAGPRSARALADLVEGQARELHVVVAEVLRVVPKLFQPPAML